MANITRLHLSGLSPEKESCDALILFAAEKDLSAFETFRKVDRRIRKRLSALLVQEKFAGKIGDQIVYHATSGLRARRVVVVGVGKKDNFTEESLRRAAATGAAAARNAACSRVAFTAPEELKTGLESAIRAVAEGALLGSYRFIKFKTRQEEIEPEKRIDSISILASRNSANKRTLELAQIHAEATLFARDLVNEPANSLNPAVLADIAKDVAKESGLKFRVLEAPELKKLGAGAILGVGGGSAVPPRLIELSYASGIKKAKKIALVGKGITFDSGGLSLKPSKYMETMKSDMAGAAAVLATMRALPKIKPSCDVIAVLCAAENMPSGSAIRPGDVLQAMNGKYIEVINTDAEGRLVLADGLSWAVKQGATEIIDLATLTGACIIGLGPYIAGAMGNDDTLIKRIIEAGAKTGEQYWQLPIPDDYDFMIKSDVADIKNLAQNSEAGAIQGALFLREFVGSAKWVHLDIAGPSWYEKDFFYNIKNGTGFGARTLLQLLSN
jgi:leucyl aminopeptidase